ncbi:hypothetical protein A2943_00230 [Candidatus Adlerbacteria bacterium RIFCSPLOWO2_01_FULL_51_16]|uniref:Uncharacterized protein n=1 Tax=Candidatus Adlerbacteria bacterium RIFCSPLOWO2_01_FULL_51_16 TaxID=1797243 RepID=A0A1F4XF57_9BACT|nr:MAG: hypothetical protein A2943_00230 [Candidatus Adlerbacteria bacterium RIFCSPLOWO2_01_FULL_51_16]
MNHDKLLWWSFVWSEVRLLIAAVALFIGGVPPALSLAVNIPGALPLVLLGLKLCWIISGLSAAYLLYRWAEHRTLFGKKDTWDSAAFAVMVVSGLNLGFVGLLGQNIGMSISSNYIVFVVVAGLYVVSAIYLHQRWSAHGQKLF